MESHFLVEIEKALVIFYICACSMFVMLDIIMPKLKACWQFRIQKMTEERMEKVWVLKDTTEQQNYQ